MNNKKNLLLLVFILIAMSGWYFSSPAKIIQIEDKSDYQAILSQAVIGEKNNIISVAQLTNNKKTAFILLRHFG